MFEDTTLKKVEAVLAYCRKNNLKVASAESCTGGQIAASLTCLAGSSDIFERGFVTYSNTSKTDLLNVSKELIEKQGAVSGAVACAMAEGALKNSKADIAISCTGIAGPSGGTTDKPVGTVHIAKASKTPEGIQTAHLPCDFGTQSRAVIQILTVNTALEFLISENEECFLA